MEAFQVEHELGNDYYYNHLKDSRSLKHLLGYDKFYCTLYYNKIDNGDPVREWRIFNLLHSQYKVKEFGWTKFSFRSAPAEDYWRIKKSPLFVSVNLKKDKKKCWSLWAEVLKLLILPTMFPILEFFEDFILFQ